MQLFYFHSTIVNILITSFQLIKCDNYYVMSWKKRLKSDKYAVNVFNFDQGMCDISTIFIYVMIGHLCYIDLLWSSWYYISTSLCAERIDRLVYASTTYQLWLQSVSLLHQYSTGTIPPQSALSTHACSFLALSLTLCPRRETSTTLRGVHLNFAHYSRSWLTKRRSTLNKTIPLAFFCGKAAAMHQASNSRLLKYTILVI